MDFIVANETKMKSQPSFKDLTEEPMLLYDLLMRRRAIEESDSRRYNHAMMNAGADKSAMSPSMGSSTYGGYSSTPEHSPQHHFMQPRAPSGLAGAPQRILEGVLGVAGAGRISGAAAGPGGAAGPGVVAAAHTLTPPPRTSGAHQITMTRR
eukprot:g18744.t1